MLKSLMMESLKALNREASLHGYGRATSAAASVARIPQRQPLHLLHFRRQPSNPCGRRTGTQRRCPVGQITGIRVPILVRLFLFPPLLGAAASGRAWQWLGRNAATLQLQLIRCGCGGGHGCRLRGHRGGRRSNGL